MTKQNTSKLAVRVLIGALAGIITGLIVGDYAKSIEFLGKAYVQMLVMCVYPYLIASLLHGLGKLDTQTAKLLVKRGWFVFVIGWIIVLAAMMVLSLVFPRPSVPIEIIANQNSGSVNFVSMIVPENFFSAVSNNYIPAVVLFTILYGVAMQHISNKSTFLEIMDQVKSASLTIWNWVVVIAPLGVFALFASAAGSMSIKEIEGLLLYIIVFLVGAAVFAFWILPVMITSFVPLKYRELMRELEGALVLSLVTTLSVIALPIIAQAIEKFLRDKDISDEKMKDLIGTNISLAYPFAQLGNLSVLLFFYFCSFFFQIDYSLTEKLLLPPLTLLSTIGSPSGVINAVTFISGIYHMPESTEDLYAAANVFTRYGQVALSVMGFAFTALLATFSFYGKLKFHPRKFFTAIIGGLALIGSFTLILRTVGPELFNERNLPYLHFVLPKDIRDNVNVIVYKPGQTLPPIDYDSTKVTLIDHIRITGRLQVGYNPGIIPFCYFNETGDLVGYDVANMYRLAKDLNVRLEFIPFDWNNLITDLQHHRFDLAIGGIYVTSERIQSLTSTRPYFQSPLAILARGTIANELTTRKKILNNKTLRFGIFDSPVLIQITNTLFPSNPKIMLNDYFEMTRRNDIDVAIWTFVQAKAFARSHLGYTAVIPVDFGSPMLISYFMPPDAGQLARVLDDWLELKQSEGFSAALQKQWIEGIQPNAGDHRWCLIRNVFHWAED